MSINRQFGIDPVYMRAAAIGWREAQSHIGIQAMTHAERIADEQPGFANELLAVAELSLNLLMENREAETARPNDLALLGGVYAVRSIVLAETDPPRSLAYRADAHTWLDAGAASADADALALAAFGYSRLADAGDDEAAAKLNIVITAMPQSHAVCLREVMASDEQERSAPVGAEGAGE